MRLRNCNRRRLLPVIAWVTVALGVASGVGCRGGATRGEIRYADALERLALGDTVAARADLEGALYDLPRDPRVLFQLGCLDAKAQDPERRVRGENALRAAVEAAPDSARYREAFGRLLLAQRFYGQAQNELRRAVELDPSLSRAWSGLGTALLIEWRRAPGAHALRDSALFCLERALALDPGDRASRYDAACLALFGAGAVDHARALVLPELQGRGCDPTFMLLAVAVETRAMRYRHASGVLARTLECLTPDERALWTGAGVLLPPDSSGAWAVWTQSERDSISEVFWFEQDPSPATLENERLAEHVTRRCEADFRFIPPFATQRGSETDRGEIFLRWGAPVHAGESIGDHLRTQWWSYLPDASVRPDFVFVDRYLTGDFKRVRRTSFADYMHPTPLEVVAQRSVLQFGRRPRGFHSWVARFRGRNGRTAILWNFEMAEDSTAVAVRTAAWNGPRRPRGQSLQSPVRIQRIGTRLVGRAEVDVLPPAGEVAVEIETMAPGRVTSGWRQALRRPLAIDGSDPDTLELSDLLPAYALAEGDVADPRHAVQTPRADSVVTDGRLHVYFEVYPSKSALRSSRVLEIAYRIEQRPPAWRFRDQFTAAGRARMEERAVVESTFEIRARRDREPQRLSVDVRELDTGPYAFIVTARDPVTGTTEERAWPFAIEPAMLMPLSGPP